MLGINELQVQIELHSFFYLNNQTVTCADVLMVERLKHKIQEEPACLGSNPRRFVEMLYTFHKMNRWFPVVEIPLFPNGNIQPLFYIYFLLFKCCTEYA